MLKIELSISRCRHCKHWEVLDNDGNFLEETICNINNRIVNELTEGCDKIELLEDIGKELMETLGFKKSEIKDIKC